MFNKLAIALCVILAVGAVHADEVDAETQQKIRNSLAVLLPGLRPDTIRATPVDNLYEVAFGMRLVYLTVDGRFLLQGKLIDLETRSEITEARLSELKLAAISKVGEDQMVIFGEKNTNGCLRYHGRPP